MIVKILSPAAGFGAVRYNTDKINRSSGELMRIRNFGMIGSGFDLKPQDVKNYLAAFSLSNPRVTKPQFHATISCKGRESGKEELSDLAEKWLEKMGYGDNPYLVVFHSDTPNNHVHIVSTRVGLDGQKVNDRFEKRRAQQHLRELIGKSKEQSPDNSLIQLEVYHYSTLAQFRLLLERAGFRPRIRNGDLEVYREGELRKRYSIDELSQRMKQSPGDEARLLKLRAILAKYHRVSDLNLIPEYRVLPGGRQGEVTGYHSALTRRMHQTFGVDFVFHFKGAKPPYGYTVIDHVGKQIYKGSELMKLAQLCSVSPRAANHTSQFQRSSRRAADWRASSELAAQMLAGYLDVSIESVSSKYQHLSETEQSDYRQLLSFLLRQRGVQSLGEHGLLILRDGPNSFLLDNRRLIIAELDGILSQQQASDLAKEQSISTPRSHYQGLGITADQDDELVYGRRRRGKRSQRGGR